MVRAANPAVLLIVASLAATSLFGCGGLGLESSIGTTDDELLSELGGDAGSAGDAGDSDAGDDSVNVSLTGRTYSAFLAEVTVIEPAGLQGLLSQAAEEELLFHVTDQGNNGLDIVMTVADSSGNQASCQPVYDLPRADWANPEFAIEDGATDIDIAGQPMSLDQLELSARVSDSGAVWEDALLSAVIDTRQLLGGSVPEGTNICSVVEQIGGVCLPCDDGVEACVALAVELVAEEVVIGFDPNAGGEGC